MHVAALMDAIVSDAALAGRDRRVAGCRPGRLRTKDFAGTLLAIRRARSSPRRGAAAAEVTFDFWDQFDAAQALEGAAAVPAGDLQALPAA